MSKISVIGAGQVGLTTAACFASLGHDVVCADIDVARIRGLRKGEVPFLEVGLPELVAEGLRDSRLQFVTSAREAAEQAEFTFLSVPTPRGGDGGADLTIVEAVLAEIATALAPGSIVVNKSTAPVGTVAHIGTLLADAGAPADVGVASNPEFLRGGTAVQDFLHPSRVVIGADDPDVAERVQSLYAGVDAPVVVTDSASAELIKYASNSFLATKLSFVNAIANVCDEVGADIKDVTLGMGYDPRIGFEYMEPGPGWGGSCLPKDVAALVKTAEEAGYDLGFLRTVIAVNDEQRERIVEKISAACDGSLEGKRIAIWGLTAKADTDQLHDSASVDIAKRLMARGATVSAFDPVVGESGAALGLDLSTDVYECCADAHAIAVLTGWEVFRALDFDRVKDAMATPTIVDARNILDPDALRARGFTYAGIGRR